MEHFWKDFITVNVFTLPHAFITNWHSKLTDGAHIYPPDVVNPQSHNLLMHPTVFMKAHNDASFDLHFLLNMTTGFSFTPLARHDSTTVNFIRRILHASDNEKLQNRIQVGSRRDGKRKQQRTGGQEVSHYPEDGDRLEETERDPEEDVEETMRKTLRHPGLVRTAEQIGRVSTRTVTERPYHHMDR
ncbi:hypothetical protein TTRE_0000889501 [Trichuris trichiura]|uniref:Uncharacterized protein n=1 Tax=Trichuris trichiura TaxID=36087 RepID=A0A077ZP71_TRITR|nr:hypothetical protein TTRE_0000889501 [Trichuris trichiura]